MRSALALHVAAPCLLVVTGALLGACDAREWPLADYRSGQPRATAWREPSHSPNQKTVARKPVRKTASTAAPASEAQTTAISTVTASATPPGPIAETNEASLIGLDIAETRKRLGPPKEEIERSPARVWRYRTAQCNMDVSLYPDVHTQIFRVLNYEVKSNDGTEQGRRKCISDLRAGTFSR